MSGRLSIGVAVAAAMAAAVVPTTIGALRLFLPELRHRGLHAVSLAELLARDPPDTQGLPNGSGGCIATWHQ